MTPDANVRCAGHRCPVFPANTGRYWPVFTGRYWPVFTGRYWPVCRPILGHIFTPGRDGAARIAQAQHLISPRRGGPDLLDKSERLELTEPAPNGAIIRAEIAGKASLPGPALATVGVAISEEEDAKDPRLGRQRAVADHPRQPIPTAAFGPL